MRKLYGLLSVVVVGGLVGTCPAQEIIHLQGSPVVGVMPSHQVAVPGGHSHGCATCVVTGDICPTCGRDDKCHDLIVVPTTLMAHVGNFNLGCRGSYKFPVPPQYTYHWPGMYSQRCVSEYRSPWRVPPGMPLHGHLMRAKAGQPSGKLVRLARPPKSSVPDSRIK